MSPSEEDLRAALHRGETTGPDAGEVLAAARSARRERRRTRLAVGGAVAAVLVVAGVATGLAATRSSNHPTAAAGTTSAAPAPTSCPAAVPDVTPPPKGARLDGPLLPGDTRSVLVCIYPIGGPQQARTLTGADATALVESLNSAPVTPSGNHPCTADGGASLALFPKDPAGNGRPLVGNAAGCGTITNGSASRDARSQLQLIVAGFLAGQSAAASTTPYQPAACPATASRPNWTTSGTATAAPVFPAGIRSISICRYTGTDPQSQAYSSSLTITISGNAATDLVRKVNALPAPTNGMPPCPADIGPWLVLVPTTADAPAPVVHASLSGCGVITDGTGVRTGAGDLLKLLLGDKAHGPITQ